MERVINWITAINEDIQSQVIEKFWSLGYNVGDRISMEAKDGRIVEGFLKGVHINTSYSSNEIYLYVEVYKVKNDGTPSKITNGMGTYRMKNIYKL